MTTRRLAIRVHVTTINFDAEVVPEEGGFRAMALGRFLADGASRPSAWAETEDAACSALERQMTEALGQATTETIKDQATEN